MLHIIIANTSSFQMLEILPGDPKRGFRSLNGNIECELLWLKALQSVGQRAMSRKL